MIKLPEKYNIHRAEGSLIIILIEKKQQYLFYYMIQLRIAIDTDISNWAKKTSSPFSLKP